MDLNGALICPNEAVGRRMDRQAGTKTWREDGSLKVEISCCSQSASCARRDHCGIAPKSGIAPTVDPDRATCLWWDPFAPCVFCPCASTVHVSLPLMKDIMGIRVRGEGVKSGKLIREKARSEKRAERQGAKRGSAVVRGDSIASHIGPGNCPLDLLSSAVCAHTGVLLDISHTVLPFFGSRSDLAQSSVATHVFLPLPA